MSRLIFAGTIASSNTGEGGGVSRNITSAIEPNGVTVDYNTVFGDITLPTSVSVTLDDASIVSLPVVWDDATYDQDTAGTYTIFGEIDETALPNITNLTNIEAEIDITVEPAITYDIYISPSGNDSNDGLTVGTPVLTFPVAITKAQALGGARTIKAAAGTYTLTARISLPVNISIVGDGAATTTILTDSSLNNVTSNSGSLYTIQLSSGGVTSSNQTLRDFTLRGNKSGSTRQTHGGIYISNRSGNIVLQNLIVEDHANGGISLSTTTGVKVLNCELNDNAFNSSTPGSGFSLGDFILFQCTNTEIANCTVTDAYGYGFKILGGHPVITNLIVHDCTFSVPVRTANNMPQISFEMHDGRYVGCQLYNNTFQGTCSLVADHDYASTGVQSFRLHDNTFDQLSAPWSGGGYCLELTVHDVEVDHNYFKSGQNACIATWNASETNVKRNWNIHHNVFDNPQATFPTGIIRSGYVGLADVRFDHNTVYITGNRMVCLFYIQNAGNRTPAPTGSNISCRNNVIIDYSTQDEFGGNVICRLENTSLVNFVFTHNDIFGMNTSIPSGTSNNNRITNPGLQETGARPDPFFRPLPNSQVINSGTNVGYGTTRGAYEYQDVVDSGNVESVENFNEVVVLPGTAWEDVEALLPTTVATTLDTDEIVNLEVVWAEGSYDPDVEDTYPITGTLQLLGTMTNSPLVNPTIDVTVSDATYAVDDSFADLDDWTIQDPQGGIPLTATIDGGVTIDGNDGGDQERLIHDTFVDDTDNLEIIMDHVVVESSTTAYGIGIGIQNDVNPDPNKGVIANFSTSDSVVGGSLRIQVGNGTTDNGGYNIVGTSATRHTLVVDREYQTRLKRELQGSDLLWTATTRDMVTGDVVTRVWVELGAGSLAYQSTNRLAIYHFGGAQKVTRVRVEKSGAVAPPSNIIINDSFTGTSLVGWTEQDQGNLQTLTFNEPGLTMVNSTFSRNRYNIAYDTPIGTSVQSWRMTLTWQYTGTAGRHLAIGTRNPVSPAPNHFVTATLSAAGDTGQVGIWAGEGSASNTAQTNVALSAGTPLTMTADVNYVTEFERSYNGSGDATYTVTAWRESVPGTTVTVQWVETGAPSQTYYNAAQWIIAEISGTSKVVNITVETL